MSSTDVEITMEPTPIRNRESGAVLVHVAIALIGLLLFSAFAVDYGIMWASRRQAQNAADAGALAAATRLAYGKPPSDPDDLADPVYGAAADAAVAVAQSNPVWGAAPRVDKALGDVEFIDCPPPLAQPGITDRCIRVDAYRNQQGGTGNVALPTFFARLAGVDTQGVRATATAAILAGNAVPKCIKPFAIADRWIESTPTATLPAGHLSVFGDTYDPPADTYSETAEATWAFPRDYGTPVLLHGTDETRVTTSWAQLISVGGPGGQATYDAMVGCVAVSLKINEAWSELVLNKPGGVEGRVNAGVAALQAAYPNTLWDHVNNSPICDDPGGCDNYRYGAIPVFNPNDGELGRADVPILDFIGIYIEGMGDDPDIEAFHPELAMFSNAERKKLVVGHVVPYAGINDGSAGAPRPSSFTRIVVLVR